MNHQRSFPSAAATRLLAMLLSCSVLLCSAISAQAAISCVTNPAQLASALTAAQSNGEDDVIYLVVGNYLLSSELQYNAAVDETYKLSIIGGIAPGCASGYASSGSSVLDGQDMVRQLYISAKGEVDIGRITFVQGNPALYFGGALNLATAPDADIYVFANQFVSNNTAAGAAGGAVYLSTSGQGDIFLWSNLMLANSGSGAGAAYINGNHNTYVTGNTILANQLINHSGLGGLDLAGTGHYWISNNILWNNEGNDVYDQNGHVDYANNDIGLKDGFTPLSESNDLSVDPDFNGGFLSVSLAPASPLVNAGLDNPPGGVGGCCDPLGGPRWVGKHVDIGAFESDVLFRGGFQ
jgi:hypothetical protein